MAMDTNERELIEDQIRSLRDNDFQDFSRIYAITKKVMRNAPLPDADVQITNANEHWYLATNANTYDRALLEVARGRRHLVYGAHVCYSCLIQFETEDARDYLEAARTAYGHIDYKFKRESIDLNIILDGLEFLSEPKRSNDLSVLNNSCRQFREANEKIAEYYAKFCEFYKLVHETYPLDEKVLTAKEIQQKTVKEWIWENFVLLGAYAFAIAVVAHITYDYVVNPLIKLAWHFWTGIK
jgi:hypothetical protein